MLIRHIVLEETQQSLGETQQSLKHRNISKKTASFISLLFSKLNFSQNDEERGSSWFMRNNIQAEKANHTF
jgi:hypothetical protein